MLKRISMNNFIKRFVETRWLFLNMFPEMFSTNFKITFDKSDFLFKRDKRGYWRIYEKN